MRKYMSNQNMMLLLVALVAIAGLVCGAVALAQERHGDNFLQRRHIADNAVGADELDEAGNYVVNDLTTNGALRGKEVSPVIRNGDANLTITKDLHAGKTVLQLDVSADRTYTLPAPEEGVVYHFIGFGTGAAADGHDVILRCTDNTNFLEGTVNHLDTGGNTAAVWGNGTNHDQLQINVPAAYDITLIGRSSTVYYVFGSVTSATTPAFSNA